MHVYKVIGSVVSTVKNDGLIGTKLLVVAPLEDGQPNDPIVAVDAVGAGRGEVVLVVTGGAARVLPETRNAPVDAVIIAIVDRLESEGWTNYWKD